MKKGKVILTAIALFAVIGGALAFKVSRDTDVLYYKLGTACPVSSFLTIATPGAITVAPPAGATGWYTTPLCNTTLTFSAKASPL